MSLVYTADSGMTGGRRSHLYIGGRADAKDREKLERWGVTHILNVTPPKTAGIQAGVPNFFEKDKAFVYKRIPVYDTSASASDLLDQADNIVNFISKGLYHGAVLVHCNMGQSRSTTAAIFFLIRKANMSLSKALEMIQRRRPTAEPIPAFREILETFEAKCIKEREEDGESKNAREPEKKRGASLPGDKSEEKRRKVGPSIGPSRGPAIGPSKGPSKAPIGPTIGPSMPPSEPKPKTVIGPAKPASAKQGAQIGPEGRPETAKAPVGPAPPPATSNSSSRKHPIGPSLPPSP